MGPNEVTKEYLGTGFQNSDNPFDTAMPGGLQHCWKDLNAGYLQMDKDARECSHLLRLCIAGSMSATESHDFSASSMS